MSNVRLYSRPCPNCGEPIYRYSKAKTCLECYKASKAPVDYGRKENVVLQEIVEMRDKGMLSYQKIGDQMGFSRQRAHQLYLRGKKLPPEVIKPKFRNTYPGTNEPTVADVPKPWAIKCPNCYSTRTHTESGPVEGQSMLDQWNQIEKALTLCSPIEMTFRTFYFKAHRCSVCNCQWGYEVQEGSRLIIPAYPTIMGRIKRLFKRTPNE